MDPAGWTFLILGLAIIAFVSGRVPLAIVSLGVALALWATGVLTLNQSLAGFGDPTVLFIASLFVVSEVHISISGSCICVRAAPGFAGSTIALSLSAVRAFAVAPGEGRSECLSLECRGSRRLNRRASRCSL